MGVVEGLAEEGVDEEEEGGDGDEEEEEGEGGDGEEEGEAGEKTRAGFVLVTTMSLSSPVNVVQSSA